MFSVPSPLHPAIVHFPIVLLTLGTLVAVAAVITRRWQLPLLAALLLGLGSLGTLVALKTGESEGELVGEQAPLGQLLDEHEDWAERTLATSALATVLAGLALALGRRPVAGRLASGATALVAIVGFICVVETGHRGGQLVYRHGAGVALQGTQAPGAMTSSDTLSTGRHSDHDKD
jgi:uncharacterized membrane protein